MAKKTVEKLRKFRLVKGAGHHFEPNPEFNPELPEDDDNQKEIKHVAGDVVTSKRDLTKVFVGKFEKVHKDEEEEVSAEDTTNPLDDEDEEEVETESALDDDEDAPKETPKKKHTKHKK